MTDFHMLKRGDAIIVKYGRRGTQLASVEVPENCGYIKAYKWSRNRERWTKHPVTVMSHEYVRRVRPGEAIPKR